MEQPLPPAGHGTPSIRQVWTAYDFMFDALHETRPIGFYCTRVSSGSIIYLMLIWAILSFLIPLFLI
jgi:hypothetical protein